MPMSIGQALGKTLEAAPALLTWQVWLAYIIPFAMLLTAFGIFYAITRWKMRAKRVLYVHADGTAHLFDDRGKGDHLKHDGKEHDYKEGSQKILLMSRIWGRRPLHVFVSWRVTELTMDEQGFSTGLENPLVMKAWKESHVTDKLLKRPTDAAFAVVLGIACFLLGVVVSFVVSSGMLSKAKKP